MDREKFVDVTKDIRAEVEFASFGGMLVYLYNSTNRKAGFLDLHGFHPMIDASGKSEFIAEDYSAVSGGTWFKIKRSVKALPFFTLTASQFSGTSLIRSFNLSDDEVDLLETDPMVNPNDLASIMNKIAEIKKH